MNETIGKLIVASARTWLGTPFHLHGRIKKVGCDCLGLIMGVCDELALKTKNGKHVSMLDQTGYHIVCDGWFLEEVLEKNFSSGETVSIGNLALLSFDSNPQHLGIIADYYRSGYSLIHAHLKHGVIEQPFDEEMKKKLKRIYKFIR